MGSSSTPFPIVIAMLQDQKAPLVVNPDSLNGMLIQVAVALIVYGLLVLYNQDAVFSPARLLGQIQQEFEGAIWLHGYLLGFWHAVRLLFPMPSPSS